MKRIFIPITILLTAIGATAQPYTIQFAASACETNASAVTTYTPNNDMPLHGFIEAIIVDQTGTATGTVNVATLVSKGTGPSRTILSIATVSADAVYPVRDIVATTAGVDIGTEPCKIPLVGDNLRLTLYNWGATGITAQVWCIITPEQ